MCEHELWNELGNLYFLSGSYKHAVRAYSRAIELHPGAGEPYNNLALAYIQMGKYPEAAEYYQRGIQMLRDELDKAISLHKLGEVYLHLRQFSQAADTYQQTEKLVPDLGQIVEASEPSDLLLHCSAAPFPVEQARDEKDELSFEPGLSPFVEELTPWWFDDQVEPDDMPEPDYDYWYMDESGVYSAGKGFDSTAPEAGGSIRKDQDTTKDDQQGLDHEGVVASESEGDTWEGSAPLDLENEATTVAGEPFVSEELPQDKDNGFVEIEATPMPVIVSSGEPEIMTGTPEFSVESMTDPEAVQYETQVEWPAAELSETEKSEILAEINKLKRVLEINPRNAFAWDSIGGHYKTLGQYDDAIEAYQKAASLDSGKAFYFHHLGLVYAAIGRQEDAINAFERVIDIDPNHSLANATLGGYYRKNGNEELAKKHIEKARQLIANDENEYNLACMEAICGNIDHSLELLELALKNKQTYVNWARKDPDLDFVRNDPRFQELLSEYAVKTT